MPGQWIQLDGNDAVGFDVYLALPPSATGPAIILLHEIFGVNDYIKKMADLYSSEGFVVACPDIYWRQERRVGLSPTEDNLAAALDHHDRLDVLLAAEDVAATANAMRVHPAVTGKVATLGFCLGGRLAYLGAVKTKLDAAVSYYGPYIERYLDYAQDLSCPLIVHCAEEDPHIPPSAVKAIVDEFTGNPSVKIYEYSGVNHGFNRVGGEHYDWKAAMLAHSRTMHLLRQEMGAVGI